MRGLRSNRTLLAAAHQLLGSALAFAGAAGGVAAESQIDRESVEVRVLGAFI